MKLVVTQNITPDGVIEMVTDWFSPQGEGDDTADQQAVIDRQMGEEDGFLVGRQTFEDMRSYWPNQTNDTTGITAHLNRVDKYVVSTTIGNPQWEHTTVLGGGNAVEEVRALKEQPGGDLGVTGSITLCHALIGAGLVDEYRLYFYPIVVGRGRRLFPDGTDLGPLELVDATPFKSGVVLLTYRLEAA